MSGNLREKWIIPHRLSNRSCAALGLKGSSNRSIGRNLPFRNLTHQPIDSLLERSSFALSLSRGPSSDHRQDEAGQKETRKGDQKR
mmetsp:Transcript_27696/g.38515  ORF Transcript_27696/g.38515 Transcript_27696/m.38515 type:complete len:86 (-) Transcript_27696:70-327(-)